MIDRIASPVQPVAANATAGLATAPARAIGGAMLDALTGGGSGSGPIGTPLRAIAGEAAAALSAATGTGDPVGTARLERAVLDFAREAKAFAIGHADRGAGAVRAVLDEALAQGGAEAERLTPLGFDRAEQAIIHFERAAARLVAN